MEPITQLDPQMLATQAGHQQLTSMTPQAEKVGGPMAVLAGRVTGSRPTMMTYSKLLIRSDIRTRKPPEMYIQKKTSKYWDKTTNHNWWQDLFHQQNHL